MEFNKIVNGLYVSEDGKYRICFFNGANNKQGYTLEIWREKTGFKFNSIKETKTFCEEREVEI